MNMSHVLIVGLFAWATACLSACTSIPVTSLPRLASLKPETMDLTEIQIALRVQKGFKLEEDSVSFTLRLTNPKRSLDEAETFILLTEEAEITPALRARTKPGYVFYQFKIREEDANRATLYREKLLKIKEESAALNAGSKDNSLGINVNFKPCLIPGENPFRDPRITVFLRPTQSEDYFIFIKERAFKINSGTDHPSLHCGSS